jgi:hypothetical protein
MQNIYIFFIYKFVTKKNLYMITSVCIDCNLINTVTKQEAVPKDE